MAKLLTAPEAPANLASSGQVIEFSAEIRSFPRLREALERELVGLEAARAPDNWGARAVVGTLEFAFADAQSREVTTKLDATVSVPLVCQRCLEPFDETLEVRSRLLFVDDENGQGEQGREAWELEGDLLRPIDLVDELLVMAMPFAAKHPDVADCGVVVEEAADSESRDTVRPFAGLRAQMKAARPPDEPAEGQDADQDQQ